MESRDFVVVEAPAPGIALVRLARPDRMNALSMALSEQLLSVLEEIRNDPTIATVVLTGEGRGFCAGGDVKEMMLNRGKTLAQRHADLALMHRIPACIAEMPQVVVAAVNGFAYGAGFALALSCDLVLAARTARFGTAFLKQGLVSDFGLSYQLTRLAGPAAARRIVFLDEVLDADRAQALGLISEMLAVEDLQPRAVAIAAKIADWPGDARAAMKGLLRRAETRSHQQMLDNEAELQGRFILSREHAAAVDAFHRK
ncbi:enoyl-CoA hydratase/isomerase family protein [Amorphus sp. 3PC139-8]|uniref:enoyl-CoA hydratase/isomerase family protein n=1 Tax=Amorphus sp. 3PC139-8 TaxID=2735676 RepID=UPI00345D4FAF